MKMKDTLLFGGLFLIILFAVSCHSPTNQSMFAAASGKPDQVAAPAAVQGAPGAGLSQTQTVVLATSTPGALVKFTLDGSDPSVGTVFAGSFVVATQNAKLRAIALKDGFPNSSELSGIYNFANGVLYDPNGGTGTMGVTSIGVGSSGSLATNAYARAGYTFTGWNTKADGTGSPYTEGASYTMTAVGGSVTLYAQWSANAGKIFFYPNDGTTTSSFVSQSLATGQSANLTANSFSRVGYTFNSWNTSQDGTGTRYADGQNITMGTTGLSLYAQWTPNQYTVSFDIGTAVGGAAPTSITALYGTSITLPSGSAYHKDFSGSFAGWNDGSTTYKGTYSIPAKNITLSTAWAPITDYTNQITGLSGPRHMELLNNWVYIVTNHNTVSRFDLSGSQDTGFRLIDVDNVTQTRNDAYGLCVEQNNLFLISSNSIDQIDTQTGQIYNRTNSLSRGRSVCSDGTNFFFTDRYASTVNKMDAVSSITTLVDGLNEPSGICYDGSGGVYYTIINDQTVHWVSTQGTSDIQIAHLPGNPEDISFYIESDGSPALLVCIYTTNQVVRINKVNGTWVQTIIADSTHGGVTAPIHATHINGKIWVSTSSSIISFSIP